MMRNVLALLPVAALVVGCGNLSQEDLVFLGAIPTKQALEVRPAGAESEADDGTNTASRSMEVACAGPQDIKCHARNVSVGLNAITFSLLDLIDFIVSHPPTTRERGRRVWGPFFDFDKGNTGRFEMVRIDGGARFRFCVHAVQGSVKARDADDVTCDTDVDEDSGLALILSGELTPGNIDDARARSGEGFMTLVMARLPEFADGGRELTIDFDNTDGTNIAMEVIGQPEENGVGVREPINYTFNRNAEGAGSFGFTIFDDFDDTATVRRERLDMVAQWNSDEAGAGVMRGSGGDLEDEQIIVHQCWDAAQTQVYLQATITTTVDPILGPDGDEGRCEVSLADVERLLPAIE